MAKQFKNIEQKALHHIRKHQKDVFISESHAKLITLDELSKRLSMGKKKVSEMCIKCGWFINEDDTVEDLNYWDQIEHE